jgi:hypothetical protein
MGGLREWVKGTNPTQCGVSSGERLRGRGCQGGHGRESGGEEEDGARGKQRRGSRGE